MTPPWIAGMFAVFISHQWLATTAPDPSGHQLAVLRQVLERLIDKSLKVETDMSRMMDMGRCTSYEKIEHGYLFLDWSLRLSLEQLVFLGEKLVIHTHTVNVLRMEFKDNPLSDPFHLVQLRFAIPQITARTDGINEDTTRSDAARAVQSIPAYVEACDLFLEGH